MSVLSSIESFATELEAIGEEPPPAPRWNQDWFPRLDAAAAYAMVRTLEPRRIIEVGSGHSTRFMARAVADGRLGTRITAIDPAPRASLEGLNVRWLKQPVQSAELALFGELAARDILFIDSSHQLKPGSDVEFLLQKALPRLAQGVRLHFHDIFLPDPYPASWDWRRYNEQQAVARLIGNGYAMEFSSHQMPQVSGVLARLPLKEGAIESSLWLRKL
ncbi:MAG TPA: class I SAM-dependent methyltransferase [Burkholderiales bacterium]|nr:class I SAM-dependent methyltransferase [Burkholderiales bacterium]